MKKIGLFITLLVFFLTPQLALAASLKFSPDSGTLNRGCEYNIAIELDTASAQTDGTDAVIIYDPNYFTTAIANITNGTIYQDYPGNTVDTSQNKVSISGLAQVQQPFTGKGTLATIKFQVPQTAPLGTTQLKFDFDPANPTKTTDSNVVERGTVKDVLTQAPSATYTIGSGACTAPTGTGASTVTPASAGRGAATVTPGSAGTGATSTLAPEAQKTLPSAGITEPTVILSIAGGFLVLVGIIGLALL